MNTPNNLRSADATIRVSSRASRDAPLMVHRETLLRDLPPPGNHEYVLVSDDNDRLIGIVPTREINRRLLASNPFERSRWVAMPIGAMSNLSLTDVSVENPTLERDELQCSAIREGDTLFGLAVNGDLFLSWRRMESLFSAALSDPLTSLMNRLAYERRLREEWDRSQRSNMSIGVVVVDLDDFKSVNDTYGHVVGDELLTLVGRKLEVAMRSYDVVARFGGDEFVALCLGCAPGDIEIPVSRLLNSIGEIALNVDGDRVHVEASVGAAVRHGGFSESLPEELFVAADNCLYEAKKSSRNAWRVEFGTGNEPTPEPIDCTEAITNEVAVAESAIAETTAAGNPTAPAPI
ncbi:GGDEF domain-containing protein [Fuerstiella marisgermanici]|uniref:diguanylate cyclase n=1 Tax=Fuerstiella marisgermanici TaxID=1891926 RepID=A0A1P8WG60_9PLAN|nr:GGDEF domain-containing protein [Fuerstiella marisgermanici]APZ93045.1 putative diguanylate cyclase AdrA [Fuerstiella marisgermanici]